MKGSYDEKADMWSIGVCTFMLLARGTKPSKAKASKELVANVLSGTYNFDAPEWDFISEQAKLFVSELLVLDAAKRLAARSACDHPWITGHVASRQAEHGIDDDFVDAVQGSDTHEKERVTTCEMGLLDKLYTVVSIKELLGCVVFSSRNLFQVRTNRKDKSTSSYLSIQSQKRTL